MSSHEASALGDSKSHRLRRVEQILNKHKKHPLTKQDQADILTCFRELEGDLGLTRRRISQRAKLVNRTKEQRTELVEQITNLQEDIFALKEQLSQREALIRKCKQTEKQYRAEVERILEEKDAVHAELEHLTAQQAPLATCDALLLSRLLTPSQQRLPSNGGTATTSTSALLSPQKAQLRGTRSEGALHYNGPPAAGKTDGRADDAGSDWDDEDSASNRGDEQDEGGGEALMKRLQDYFASATGEILVMTQTFTSFPLAEQLATARQRGVPVRVLLDASWLDITLRASGASRDYQSWQRVYKRFKAAGVSWAAQRGRRHTTRPTSTHIPFTHNAIIIDSATLITGPLRFADSTCTDAESSLVVVGATAPGSTPCIQSMTSLFQRLWDTQVEVEPPQEITRVRLPKI